ncbi:MAG TPA: GxGYxYP family putative glycoside hydrolase [Armatimonadota bacterium]|nr:GxGYxYP family putative glycoside hydrolase [Armatimonadota bacterium]
MDLAASLRTLAVATVLLCLAAPVCADAERDAVVYSGEINWGAHRHTFATLQGIVNREGPGLYLKAPFFYHEPVNQAWLDYYQREHDFEYEEIGDFDALIARFRPAIRGLVGFDDSPGPKTARRGKFFPIEEYLATSIGALTGMLPVPSSKRESLAQRWGLPAPDEVELLNYDGRRTGVKVRGDLADYGFETKAQAVIWALEAMFPHCSADYFYNLDHSDVDYAAQHHAFCTNLSYVDTDAGEGLTEKELLDRILTAYQQRRDKSRPYFWVIGLQPPERVGVMTLSRHGGVNHMTNMAQNWSFHTQVRSPRSQWRQQAPQGSAPASAETRYVAFIASEGTTHKAAGDGMQHGAWLDPARGKVAINWGTCAAFATQAPAVVDYYYSTATPRDYFVTGEVCAGMGFAVPPLMPAEAWQAVLADARPLWQAMDLRCIDIYANSGYYDGTVDWPQFADMCDALDALCLTFKNAVRSRGEVMAHGSRFGRGSRALQVISYPRCPEGLSHDRMIDFLFDKISSAEGPWGRKFCCIYLPIAALVDRDVDAATTIKASPSGLLRLQERLNAELGGSVRIVRLDEMVRACEAGTSDAQDTAVD